VDAGRKCPDCGKGLFYINSQRRSKIDKVIQGVVIVSLTFIFADTADANLWKEYQPVPMYFRLPEEAYRLPACHQLALDLAAFVSTLTRAALYLSCRELGIKYYPVKLETLSAAGGDVEHNRYYFVLRFERRLHLSRSESRELKIILPVMSSGLPVPAHLYTSPGGSWSNDAKAQRRWVTTVGWPITPDQKRFAASVNNGAQICLTLLNAEPIPRQGMTNWQFIGFHPYRQDASAITREKSRIKERLLEKRVQEREMAKQKAREEKLAQKRASAATDVPTTAPPTTGAGRRVGAVPGIFKGVQFRSQLEIRFVTQLEAKGIRWIYEGERLGDGQYLVDFYLPDLKTWVEVKGRIEPRDDYLLKEVADLLKRSRQEQLFVYTQSKAYRVTAREFKEIAHKDLWELLV